MTAQDLETRIRQTYPQCDVAVIDMTGTSNHFEVRISEPSLKSLSRIKQHQAVMEIFTAELKSGEVHALSIKTFSLD